jgi:hypothetical protein
MSNGSRPVMTRRILMAALGAVLLGGAAAPAKAADLGPVPGWRARHVRVSHATWNWRDRCAYAGYYCLYAEYGYVYHYPFDDRPIAYAHTRRRAR